MNSRITFVFSVIRLSILLTSILKVFKLISQKTTFPPKCSTTLAVEIHVKAGTIASSPNEKFNAAKDRLNADVHDVTAIECFDPVKFDHFSQIR